MKRIYLIQHENIPEYTKIGYTSDINARIKSLQTASPTGIRVLYTITSKDARRLEQHLHRKYASKNSHLEWFKLSHEDIAEIIFFLEEQVEKRRILDEKKNTISH